MCCPSRVACHWSGVTKATAALNQVEFAVSSSSAQKIFMGSNDDDDSVSVKGTNAMCAIDLMILLDTSGSIKSQCSGFGWPMACWTKMKNFLKKLVNSLNVGTGKTDARVGLVTFATGTRQVFSMSQYDTTKDVTDAIENIRHTGGGTSTRLGMEMLKNTLIKQSNAMADASTVNRTDPLQLVLVLTDGGFTGRPRGDTPCWQDGVYNCPDVFANNNPAGVAKRIVESGTPIYAIGVNLPRPDGSNPVGLLHDLAGGSTDLVKDVEQWEDLELPEIIQEITSKVCAPTTHKLTTLTPLTTTTATTTSVGKVCRKPVDLVFVVDVSSSIQDQCQQAPGMSCWPSCPGYQTCWPAMKDFIDGTQALFDIGSGTLQSRVSLVKFGATADVQFNFTQHTTNQGASDAVQALEYRRCLSQHPSGADKVTPGKWCQDRVDTYATLVHAMQPFEPTCSVSWGNFCSRVGSSIHIS